MANCLLMPLLLSLVDRMSSLDSSPTKFAADASHSGLIFRWMNRLRTPRQRYFIDKTAKSISDMSYDQLSATVCELAGFPTTLWTSSWNICSFCFHTPFEHGNLIEQIILTLIRKCYWLYNTVSLLWTVTSGKMMEIETLA